MSLFDAFATALTGGVYAIGKAGAKVAAGIAGQHSGETATPGGQPGGAAGYGAPVTVQCQKECCTYSIEGDYLLDCKDGDVWLIDKGKMQLHPIKRQHSKLDGAAGALNLALIREQMMQQKIAQFENLHHSVRVGIEKRFDSMIKILDAEIDAMHKP